VILYPSQLTGRRVYWLLTVDVGGVLMRMADDEVDVVTASGQVLHFSAGLDGIETTEGIDLFGDSVGQLSVPLEFIAPPGVSIAALVARGGDLSAGRGELARWVSGTTYEARRVVLVGGLSDPEYGDDGEAVATSLEERLAYDETLTSAASLATTSTNWAHTADLLDDWIDVPYPIVIGRPGYQGGSSYVTGSPAVWADHRDDGSYGSFGGRAVGNICVLAGHHVSANYVYLNNDQYTAADKRFRVINGFDLGGNPIAFVAWYITTTSADAFEYDSLAVYTWFTSTDPATTTGGPTVSFGSLYVDLEATFTSDEQLPLFVVWKDEATVNGGGGGLVRDGVLIRSAGDVLQYLLSLTSIPVDAGRFAAAAPLLDAFQFDATITERVNVWELIQDEILPLLPVSLVSGPEGLYPIVWRYSATAGDAVLVLNADTDPDVSRAGRVAYDSSDRKNRFTLEYQLSYRTGSYQASLTYGAAADAADDASVTVHPACTYARARTGLVVEQSMSSAWVYDSATARAVLEWQAAAYALPTRTVAYLVPEVAFVHVERGMIVALTDSSIYLAGALCMVRDVLTDGTGYLTLTLQLLEVPNG
jgi:hypothetical protein